MLKYENIKTIDEDHLMQTYGRLPALMVQGAGCSLWDNRGNEYLDMLAGIAVCQLGHCHPSVVSALTRQSQQLIHTSNFFLTAPQAQLAQRLCEISGMDRAFFTVCGASANETALKIAKKHGLKKRPEGDYEIVALENAFHGRTMGALSATGSPKYKDQFAPLVPGFVHTPANDTDALRKAVTEKTAAIVLEVIQGEAGVMPLSKEFLTTAQALADEYNALLIIDEVQTGIGRTGDWFAFQQYKLKPDVICVAKGLGGGVPIGACLAKGEAAELLVKGDHGSTFGGNPLACATALAVLDTIEHQNILDHVIEVGDYLTKKLKEIGSAVKEVRGRGLMIGVVFHEPIARDVANTCFERHLIVNATDDYTLRLVPPLVLKKEQAELAVNVIAGALGVRAPLGVSTVTSKPEHLHDILSIDDLNNDQAEQLLDLASYLKQQRKIAPSTISLVEGRSVAMVFEKPSLRTRYTFETAIKELGGHAIYLTKNDIGMGDRESLRDIAGNLARWSKMIVARLFWHKHIIELAEVADVPVINALTEWEHPCQALADMMTIREEFGEDKVKITYVGDGNNVARSLAKLALRLGYEFTICGPENFRLEDMPGLKQTSDMEEGLANAKAVYTDVWVSMGDEHEQEHRMKIFEDYQVNGDVMRMADRDAIFLHCLPAHRGYEVTDDVIDGVQSRIADQAENRLHAQKALIKMVLGL